VQLPLPHAAVGRKLAAAISPHIFLIERQAMIGQTASESIVDVGAGGAGRAQKPQFFATLIGREERLG